MVSNMVYVMVSNMNIGVRCEWAKGRFQEVMLMLCRVFFSLEEFFRFVLSINQVHGLLISKEKFGFFYVR